MMRVLCAHNSGYLAGAPLQVGVVQLHLQLFDPGVGHAAPEDHEVAGPPQPRLGLGPPVGRQDRLGGGLGCAGDVVSERRGHLDLQPGHVADSEAQQAGHSHPQPELTVSDLVETDDGIQFTWGANRE